MPSLCILGRAKPGRELRNAFIIEEPVPPELFFDGQEEVEFFVRNLELKKYKLLIAIVAPFKFGKTSLLLKFFEIARCYEEIIPVLLRPEVHSRPISYIVRQISKALNVQLNPKSYDDLGLLFEEIDELLVKRDRWVLLIIDEFQEIPEMVRAEGYFRGLSDRQVFAFLRGLTENFRFGLVVAGSVIDKLYDAIGVWHGRFTIMRPRSLPMEDSVEMLEKFFELSGYEIDKSLAEYIAVATRRHPFHMQLFGYHIVIESGDVITEDSVERARRKLLRKLTDYYGTKLLQIRSMGGGLVEVLRKIAMGCRSISCFDEDELRNLLELEKIGVVIREKL